MLCQGGKYLNGSQTSGSNLQEGPNFTIAYTSMHVIKDPPLQNKDTIYKPEQDLFMGD